MEEGLKKAWRGKKIWNRLRKKYRIDYDKVVIVLTDTDDEWNRYALLHLEDYRKRKNAKEALILYSDELCRETIEKYAPANATIVVIKKSHLSLLESYYCLYRFFYNIVFLTTTEFKDNNSKKIIGQGIITKEELICLGFYCLRQVPVLRNKEGCDV